MLRNQEIELIAGLVEGSLADESEARLLLERSSEARAEYEAQKMAYEALRGAPPVSLRDSERAALRRDVWTAMSAADRPGVRTVPWYYRLGPVIAVLIVVVGVGTVLTRGGLDQRSAGDAATATTTALASGELPATTTHADDGGTESAEESTEPMAEAGDGAGSDLADADLAPLPPALEVAFSQIADAVRTRGDIRETVRFRTFATSEELDEVSQCLEAAGLPNYMAFGEFEDPSGGETTYLVVVQSNDEIGPDTQVVFIDTANCEIADVEG